MSKPINKAIEIQIIESTPDLVRVQLPFLEVPVEMNREFFNRRIQSGYFRIQL